MNRDGFLVIVLNQWGLGLSAKRWVVGSDDRAIGTQSEVFVARTLQWRAQSWQAAAHSARERRHHWRWQRAERRAQRTGRDQCKVGMDWKWNANAATGLVSFPSACVSLSLFLFLSLSFSLSVSVCVCVFRAAVSYSQLRPRLWALPFQRSGPQWAVPLAVPQSDKQTKKEEGVDRQWKWKGRGGRRRDAISIRFFWLQSHWCAIHSSTVLRFHCPRTAPACLRPPCACYFGGSGDAEDGSQRVSLAGLERKHSPSLERTLSWGRAASTVSGAHQHSQHHCSSINLAQLLSSLSLLRLKLSAIWL